MVQILRSLRYGVIAAALVNATPAFAQANAPKLDSGDTAWMLVATALVLMMTVPRLVLFYGGMVRKKNVLSTAGSSSPSSRTSCKSAAARSMRPPTRCDR